MKRLFQLLPFLFLCTFLGAQEICDNGIDDDGDGLVDLNDTEDCECFTDVPTSLIPNPSFEDNTCCPTVEAQLDCAIGWSQASGPTTDYVHECGFLGLPFLGKFAPLPFPDGVGAIGFRDGKAGAPDFKEYAGSCLTDPMSPGTEYRLDFFVGFPDDDSATFFDMSLYATTDCDNLPFGNGSQTIGCPTNDDGWVLLGRKSVSGQNEWVNVVFEFTPLETYEAIVLGPSCDHNPNVDQNPYFFFDRLLLAERGEFGVPFDNVEGSICAEGVTLSIDLQDAISYQWYHNGVALQGFNQSSITLQDSQNPLGQYQVIVETPDECFSSQIYNMTIPVYEGFDTQNICGNDTIIIGNQIITAPDEYVLNLIAEDGCDSILTLLVETPVYEGFDTAELCGSDTIFIGSEIITEADEYIVTILADDGCDSILTLLVETPVYENDDYQYLCEGDSLDFGGEIITIEDQYIHTFLAENGCDSIVSLIVEVGKHTDYQIDATICEGENYNIDGFEFDEEGSYDYIIPNEANCDSSITLNLTVIPHKGIELDEELIEINLGDEITIIPSYVHPGLDNFRWEDQDGNIISTSENIDLFQPTGSMELILNANDEYGCPSSDSVELRVIRDVRVFIPNVFTPEEVLNPSFTVFTNRSVAQIAEIDIYDRWGELVFSDKNTGPINEYRGWDGRFNGDFAQTGVYVYLVTVDIIDDTQEVYTGSITLIR